jgi:hypothetical protein
MTRRHGSIKRLWRVTFAAGDYPIPVAIVPGHLTDDEIDALSG